MSLIIRPLYRPLRLTELMDRLFDESFARGSVSQFPMETLSIPMDVVARDDEFVISAVVPGLNPDDLQVEVLGTTVTLRGEIIAPSLDEKASVLLQERAFGKFSRTLTLPAEVEGAKAEANVENGVLTLRLPKAEAAKPKAIKIRAK
jgi:HSP20 family protein